MRPTRTQFAAYQQLFDYYNQRLFENSLTDCMLSFSRRRSSSHTLFTAGQWREDTGPATAEINLNLRQLSEGEPMEVMATLVRQMVHLWQERYGSPSRNGYFNREWAEKMEEIGLIPSATGLPGGRRTGQGIKHYIETEGRFARAYREMPPTYLWPFLPTTLAKNTNDTSRKVMYRCAGCGIRVWGKGGLGLVCECGGIFTDAAGEAKTGLREKVYRILAEQYAAKKTTQKRRRCMRKVERESFSPRPGGLRDKELHLSWRRQVRIIMLAPCLWGVVKAKIIAY